LRIESRKKRGRAMRFLLRVCAVLAGLGLLAGGGWLAAEHVATKKATALYVANKDSPTRALRALEEFAGASPLWGQSYVNARLEELEPLAEEERAGMAAEARAVLASAADPGKDLEFRLGRVQNFLKKYEGIFEDVGPYREVRAR